MEGSKNNNFQRIFTSFLQRARQPRLSSRRFIRYRTIFVSFSRRKIVVAYDGTADNPKWRNEEETKC